ncbi:MAG TPA: hypothetical protein VIK18_02020, partial [Pirellulales bacterium]
SAGFGVSNTTGNDNRQGAGNGYSSQAAANSNFGNYGTRPNAQTGNSFNSQNSNYRGNSNYGSGSQYGLGTLQAYPQLNTGGGFSSDQSGYRPSTSTPQSQTGNRAGYRPTYNDLNSGAYTDFKHNDGGYHNNGYQSGNQGSADQPYTGSSSGSGS